MLARILGSVFLQLFGIMFMLAILIYYTLSFLVFDHRAYQKMWIKYKQDFRDGLWLYTLPWEN